MDFFNAHVGLIITGINASPLTKSSAHETIDGGYAWKEVTLPDNDGLNAVKMCDVNEALMVGEVTGGFGTIIHLSG